MGQPQIARVHAAGRDRDRRPGREPLVLVEGLGYAAWMAPTFIIKFLAVAICCLIAEKAMHRSLLGYGVGAVAGGAFQIGAYTLAKVLMYDKTYALTTLPELAIQTAVGIAVAGVLVVILTKSGAGAKLQRMAGGAGKEAKAA